MATDFQVFLVAGSDEHAAEGALAALDVVEQVESQLTVYRPDSDVADVNRRAAAGPVVVADSLYDLIALAIELHRITQGAFDCTAGPLSQIWGFSRREGRIPTADELAAALECVGSQHLQLDRHTHSVRFLRNGTTINFNSLGKGYALDRCREVLAGWGVRDFLLHGGQSSVLAAGSPDGTVASEGEVAAGSRGWTVGIGHPLRPNRRMAELFVTDRAVGTSGASFQFFRHGGKRYGHILDPRTGMPAEGVFSVSVVAPTAAEADALATAFYVMGSAEAERFCVDRPDVGFVMLLPRAGGSGVELVACNLPDDACRVVADSDSP